MAFPGEGPASFVARGPCSGPARRGGRWASIIPFDGAAGGVRDPATIERLRATVFRLRGAASAAAFVVVWLAARPTFALMAIALGLVAAGHALRFWAAGYIPAYRGESLEAPRLATEGPYALVRNPLYIGNGLIGLGWCTPAGPIALAVFPALFAILYCIAIVPHEEAYLSAAFGERYEEYRDRVSMLCPLPRGRKR